MQLSTVKRSLAVALVVLLGFGLTACANRASWIAQVNGHTIPDNNFAEGVQLFSTLQGATPETTTTVPTPGTVPVSDAWSYAALLVQSELVSELNAKHGVTVTQADRDTVQKGFLDPQSGIPGFAKFPEWFQDQLVTMQAGYAALVGYFGKNVDQSAAAKKVYDANKSQFSDICISAIVTKEDVNANAIRAQITGPGNFADVAKASATEEEPVQGEKKDGDVGCLPGSQLSQMLLPADYANLESAPDGKILGPLSMAGGPFIIILKTSTSEQSFDEVKASILAQMGSPGQAKADAAMAKALKEANVKLNPRIGTWTDGKGYEAPVGAQPAPGVTTTLPQGLQPQPGAAQSGQTP